MNGPGTPEPGVPAEAAAELDGIRNRQHGLHLAVAASPMGRYRAGQQAARELLGARPVLGEALEQALTGLTVRRLSELLRAAVDGENATVDSILSDLDGDEIIILVTAARTIADRGETIARGMR